MAQRDLLIQPVSSPCAQSPPLVSSKQLTGKCVQLPKICSPRHFCLPSKPVFLIYLWSSVVGAIFAAAFDIIIGLGVSAQHNTNRDVLVWLIVAPYAVLTLVLLLYPVSGFLADVCCGRYRTITFSLFLLWCAFVPLSIVSVLLFLDIKKTASYIPLGGIAFILITTGLAGYQANIIQLGLDQLHEAPCRYLGLFIHWNGWCGTLGAFVCHIIITMWAFYNKQDGIAERVVQSLPWVFLLILSVLLAFSCYNHQWFYSEPGQHNPYRTVFKVLSFAKKHKHPIQCSAFTYCEDERPTRIDFAKRKFGGPFDTDQVEDVKTFLRILRLLFSLGPVFLLEVPTSSFVFIVFGLHISVGKQVEFNYKGHRSLPRWLFLESGVLQAILAIVVLPVYIWVVYSVLYRRIPRILSRLKLTVVLFLIGVLSMLVIDVTGHIKANHHGNANSSHCMFIAESKKFDFSPLNMTQWALIPPNVILGIAPLLLDITVFEFISAQSPHSMKGLLIGMFFAIKGFFQFIGAVSLIPFTLPTIWDFKHKRVSAIINCGFGYLLFTSVVALVGFILFLVTARSYQYRQRDEKPYDHQYVETYYKQYTRPPRVQPSPDEESPPILSGGPEPGGVTGRGSCNNYGTVKHTDSCNDLSLSFDWD